MFDIFMQTEIKEMFPPVFKMFLFYKSSCGFIMSGIFRSFPNTWSDNLQEVHTWRLCLLE